MANLVILPGKIAGNQNGSLPALQVDQAYVRIQSTLEKALPLYVQGRQCIGCKLYKFHELQPRQGLTFILNTKGSFGTYLQVDSGPNCGPFDGFEEGGRYEINVKNSASESPVCEMQTLREPNNIYLPLLYAACFYICLAAIYGLTSFLLKKCRSGSGKQLQNGMSLNNSSHTSSVDEDVQDQHQENSTRFRVISLDVFRGLTMAICLFVINGAGGYYFLDHALWNGLYLSDFVFPWFMWIMGAGITFSITSGIRRNVSRFSLAVRILRRSILLFLFGVMFNTSYGHNDLTKLRVPGVLQRFAIAYLIVAFISLILADGYSPKFKRWWDIGSTCGGRFKFFVEWIFYGGVLAAHTYLTFYMEVPGCPKGYLGPGGDHAGGKYRNCTGGAAGYIDLLLLGKRHIYQNPTFKMLYHSPAFDPEGVLGCLTTIFMVFTGVKAGRIIQNHSKHAVRILWWVMWSIITGVAALVLSKASVNDGWIPINKNLWSVSFIMSISSTAFIILTLLYVVVDLKRFWSGGPFLQPGKNSLLVYLGSSLLGQLFPWSWKVDNTHGMKTFIGLWQTTLWVLITIYLHRKKMYFTL